MTGASVARGAVTGGSVVGGVVVVVTGTVVTGTVVRGAVATGVVCAGVVCAGNVVGATVVAAVVAEVAAGRALSFFGPAALPIAPMARTPMAIHAQSGSSSHFLLGQATCGALTTEINWVGCPLGGGNCGGGKSFMEAPWTF